MIERYLLTGDVSIGRAIAAEEVSTFARRHGGRGMIVSGSSNVAEPVAAACDLAAIRVPEVRSVPDLVKAAAHEELDTVDWLVAIGGAATLDVAKLLRARTPDGHDPYRECRTHADLAHVVGERSPSFLPLLALPTVIGSGAEISTLSDVLRTHSSVRIPVIHPGLAPTATVIDLDLVEAAPAHVAASSAFDGLMHLLDPWLGRLPAAGMQSLTSETVATELVQCIRGQGSLTASASLARLSHLAITPGLARIGGHASCAHRIEHAVPAGVFKTHGEGLAHVVVRMLRWAEQERRSELRDWGPALCRVFGRFARPSVLLEAFAAELHLDTEATLDVATVDAVVEGVEAEFCAGGHLPGSLRISSSDVRSILGGAPAARPRTRSLLAEAPPFGPKVFGRERPNDVARCIITPIPAIASAFPGAEDSPAAWFPTRLARAREGTVLVLQVPPGASGARAGLDLLEAWLDRPVPVTFLGFAGALSEGLTIGSWTFACDLDGSDAARSPSYLPRIHSVDDLSVESDECFDYLRWLGVDLVDLEALTVTEWCRARDVSVDVAVVVSDKPRSDLPLWALPGAGAAAELDLGSASRAMVRELWSRIQADA